MFQIWLALFVFKVYENSLNCVPKLTLCSYWKRQSCRLWFDSEVGQTNDFKIGIYSFFAWRSALKGQCGEQACEFACCAIGKDT